MAYGSDVTLYNNTVANNYITFASNSSGGGLYAYSGSSFSGVNNIIYFNQSAFNPDISGTMNLSYSCCSQTLNGTGNITSNPTFVDYLNNNFNLQAVSPCIDAGDPLSPLDPDSTIADMGVLFYDQSGIPSELFVTLTPENPPIQIPANGGSFDFNIEVGNNGTASQEIDIWTMVTLPNGTEYGPIINFPDFIINPGWSGNRDRTQDVPGSAPTGMYIYDAYLGTYPSVVLAEDHFDFTKTAVDNGGGYVNDWSNRGESFEDIAETGSLLVEAYALHNSYPNPFNPTATIAYDLVGTTNVQLVVYDVTGRIAATLVDGFMPAGQHFAEFNGQGLSSGVYFVKLTAGTFTDTKKMILMK